MPEAPYKLFRARILRLPAYGNLIVGWDGYGCGVFELDSHKFLDLDIKF